MESSALDMFQAAIKNQMKGNLPQAMTQLDAVLLADQTFHPAWASRAGILKALGHPFDAVLNYNCAINLVPDDASYYNDRGTAYMDLERWGTALDDFKRANARDNKIPEVYFNIGATLLRQRKVRESLEYFQKAIALRPGYANAKLSLSMAHLMLGELETGFEQFEVRWDCGQMKKRNLPYPEWEGERADDPNDILLLCGEQGMGDSIQFCRYAKLVKARWGAKVYLEVQHPVVRLLRGVEGVDGILAFGEKMPFGIKACITMLSAPRVLKTTLDTIPGECPYLPYDDFRASLWRDRLKNLPPGLKVGLCWAGMNREDDVTARSIDSRRSMQLADFKTLGALKGISWVSLQLGPPKEQLRLNPAGMTIGDWTSDLYDFFDTAALIQCLDLVITVDTSVAHVAAGLGKPTWLLSRYDACWRWLMDRDDTPWYPTMRLFTQKKPYDWEGVLERMIMPLQTLANQARQRDAA